MEESPTVTGVTMSMPEGHAILDYGAAVDYIGEVVTIGEKPPVQKRMRCRD